MNPNFDDYFSFDAILGDLIRWRVRAKSRNLDELKGMLPPRREWSRGGIREREGLDPAIVRRRAIRRTVHRMRMDGTISDFRWGRKLLSFVDDIRRRISSEDISFDIPSMMEIRKGYKGGVLEYRQVASFDNLSDKVIISRMKAYVRDRLDEKLSASCYSFRRDSSITHQTAVERLQRHRADYPDGSLFVGECDIKKFFDNISHAVVRKRWEESGLFEPSAGKVLEAYLNAYAAPQPDGEPRRDGYAEGVRRGIPQGGSLSPILANLVLAVADKAVEKVDAGRLFYARFCDDVVFVHPEMAVCRRAMKVYVDTLQELDLPMHPVESFVYKPLNGAQTTYYGIKSKGPFLWHVARSGEENCAPWLSFLGSQIRFDGETRIRKESIEKHIRALGRETARFVTEIKDGKVREENADNRFCGFRNRLIAKGVGYVTAKVEERGICWAGAFPNVTPCADTKSQMRRLDRVREGMVSKARRVLQAVLWLDHHHYKGRPYSYFGFLEKVERPTNMAVRRRINNREKNKTA